MGYEYPELHRLDVPAGTFRSHVALGTIKSAWRVGGFIITGSILSYSPEDMSSPPSAFGVLSDYQNEIFDLLICPLATSCFARHSRTNDSALQLSKINIAQHSPLDYSPVMVFLDGYSISALKYLKAASCLLACTNYYCYAASSIDSFQAQILALELDHWTGGQVISDADVYSDILTAKDYLLVGVLENSKRYLQMYELVLNLPTELVGTLKVSSIAAVDTAISSAAPSDPITSVRFAGSPGRVIASVLGNNFFLYERKPCHPDCLTCSGPGQNECLSCIPKQILQSGQCSACHPTCLMCTPTSAPFCESCPSAKFLTEWQENSTKYFCNARMGGTYLDASNVQRFCMYNCSQCTNTTGCLACKPGFKFLENTSLCVKCFVDNMIPGVYYDAGQGLCKSCDSNCTQCITSRSFCTQCSTTSEVSRLNQTCVDINQAPVGYYFDSTFTSSYLQCDPNCKTCGNHGPSYCTSCYTSYYLMPNKTCTLSCPVGFSTNETGMSCDRCVWPCKTCSAHANNCTTCLEGLLLAVGLGPTWTCTFTGSGYFTDPITGSMQSCASNCTGGCDWANVSKCLQCSFNSSATVQKYPSATNWTCDYCGAGYSLTSNNVCEPCHPSCKTCGPYQLSYCTSCPTGAFLDYNNKRCTQGVPLSNYYNDSLNQTYYRCDPNCLSCSIMTSYCQSCMPGYYLYSTGSTCMPVSSLYQYVDLNNRTQPCSFSCDRCYTTGVCFSCASPYFLNPATGSCMMGCPIGYKILKNSCRKCASNCAGCNLTENHCISCASGYRFLDGTQTCVLCNVRGQYVNSVGKCDYCSPSCLACSGLPDNCTDCFPPAKPVLGPSNKYSCLANPGQNYMVLLTNNTYVQCASSCGSCNVSPTNCGDCVPTLYQNTAILGICSPCSGQSFKSGNLCHKCSSTCSGCSQSPYNCTNCASTLQKFPDSTCGNCASTVGFYVSGTSCLRCSPNCLTCSGSAVFCISCKSGLRLNNANGTCGIDPCSQGTYFKALTQTCEACSPDCNSCSDTPANCTSCAAGKLLRLDTRTCELCSSGFLIDLNNKKCMPCHASCASCAISSTHCISCPYSTYLLSDGTCSPCIGLENYRLNSDCKFCHYSCMTCSGPNINMCTGCYPNFSLVGGACLSAKSCNSSSLYNSSTNQCEPCDSNCASCRVLNTTCTSCVSGQYISAVNLTCATCGNGYYLGPDMKCYQCSPRCLTCSGLSTECVTCHVGESYFPDSKTCGFCVAPWFTNGSSCYPCDSLCKSCAGKANNCTECIAGTAFNAGTSQCKICPEGSLVLGGECRSCSPNCKTCSGLSTNCTSCDHNVGFLANESCVSCPAGFYATYSGRCAQCDNNCLTCSGSATRCLTCKPVEYLSEVNLVCSPICGAGYYVDGGNCRVCAQNCQACQMSATNCTKCHDGKLLDLQGGLGRCLSSCPAGSYIDSGDNFCKLCDSNCLQCYGTSSNCTVCPFGLSLSPNDSKCVSCGPGYIITLNNTCIQCDPNCAKCVGSVSNCSSCATSSFLMAINSTCAANCSSGFYQAGGNCRKCIFPCDTCSGPTSCLTCQDGLYIHATSNNCTRCATGNYLNASDSRCYPCNTSNCISCAGDPNNCTSCMLTPTFDSEIGATVFKYVSASNQSCSRCLNDFTVLRDICYTNVSTCGLSLGNFNKCVTDRVIPCGILNGTQLARNVSNLSDCVVCPLGWYVTLNGICMKCNNNCTACKGISSNCTACKDQYSVYYVDYSCRLVTDGFFIDPVDSLLKDCNSNCTTCFGSFNNCITVNVNSGYLLYELPNGTIGKAPPGMMYTEGSIINCSSNCKTCLWSPNSCRGCFSGKLLDESDYTCNTPRYAWLNTSDIMARCDQNCEACSGSKNNCLSCFPGYYRSYTNDSTIVCLAVNESLYYDSGQDVLFPCAPGCSECVGQAGRCTKCIGSMMISGSTGECVTCDTNNGSMVLSGYCFSCKEKCKTCTVSPDNCLSCQPGYYLLADGSCGTCSRGTYSDGVSCLPCPVGCASCNSSSCDSCWQNYSLVSGICQSACLLSEYLDDISRSCQPCSTNCRSCFGSPTNCTSCFASSYISEINQTCTECGLGYLNLNSICKKCDPSCASCDLVISKCLSCQTGFAFTIDHRCEACTAIGMHVNGSEICERCPIGCKTCVDGTSECTECYPGYFKSANSGGSSCMLLAPGYFVEETNDLLYKCSSKCTTCAKNSTFCTSCNTSQALSSYNGYCVSCPDGFYVKNDLCRPCESFCRTCSGEAYRCTSCFASAYLSPNNNSCTACTGGGFYKTEAGKCLPCEATCKTCDSWTGICNNCKSGMVLMYDRVVCTECKGYKFRGADNKCHFCDVNCADCAGTPTNCTSCVGSVLSIENRTCSICGPGYFVNGDYCYKCDSSCAECASWPNRCTACPSNQILMTSNYTCVDACPLEHFITPYGECSPCAASCAECEALTGVCTKCRSGLYISAQTRKCDWCHEESGYYVNKSNNWCYKCQEVCHTCNNDSTCTSCEPNYFISETNGTCTPCGDGFFVDTLVNNDNLCKPCVNGCRTCMYNRNHCLDCLPGLFFMPHNRTCVPMCGAGFYFDLLGFCVPCSSNCTFCTPPHGWCVQCKFGLVVAYLQEQRYCVAPCPDRWYFDYVDSTCKPCSIHCSSCSVTSTNCTSCAQTNDKMWLSTLNATCAPCGDGYFAGPQGKCFPCTGSCTKCPINSTQTCAACVGSSLVVADWGVCVATMSDKTFLTATWTAAQCSDNCEACDITAATCTRCAPGFVLSVETRTCGACGRGFYELAGLCYRCAADCVECSSLGCSKCQPGLYSQAGLCLPCLPGSTATADGACVACSGGCATCQYLPTNCLSCATTGHTVSALNLTCGPCGDGYFTSPQDGRCYQCDSNCKTCMTRSKTCTSCNVSILSALNYTCAPCGPGYFQDATDSRCYKCGPNCLTCQGAGNICTSCKSPLMLTLPGDNCTDCTFSPTYMIQNGQCLICLGNCYSCFGTQTNCTLCNPGEFVAVDPITGEGTCGVCTAINTYRTATHCVTCSSNCRSCSSSPTNCLTCAPPNYLRRDQNNTCSPSCNAVEGVYSITVAGGYLECLSCDPTCQTCSGPGSTLCTSCGLTTYLEIDGTCQPCLVGCDTCHSPTLCDACSTNYLIQSDSTCLVQYCPSGRFIHGNLCAPCGTNCANCFGSAASCTSCIAGQYLSATNTCVPCTENGYYHNSTNCLQCDSSCLTCNGGESKDCLSCDTTQFFFNGGYCRNQTDEVFGLKLLNGDEPASSLYDLSYYLKPEYGFFPRQEDTKTSFWRAVIAQTLIEVKVICNSTNQTIETRLEVLPRADSLAIMLWLKFVSRPKEDHYFIYIRWQNKSAQILWKDVTHSLISSANTTEWTNPIPAEELQHDANHGEMSGVMMSANTGKLDSSASTAVGLLLAGDPTGVMTKFSQTIKVISRLLYLNVPYGQRVMVFLDEADSASGTLREASYSKTNLKSNAYHGRLSSYRVLVTADSTMWIRLILYFSSWAIKVVSSTIISSEMAATKIVLAFLYFSPKVHLILFSTFMADFCFYFSRTLLHSIEANSRIIAFCVLVLVVLDLLTVVELVWRDEPWLEVYRNTKKELQRREKLLKLSKELSQYGQVMSAQSLTMNSMPTKTSFSKVSFYPPRGSMEAIPDILSAEGSSRPNKVKVIDYATTYRHIIHNMHLINVMSAQLSERKDVLIHRACRSHFLIHSVRVVVYQLVLVSGQYNFTLASIGLAGMEVVRLCITVKMYVQKRHYRTTIHFIMDISQSCFLLVFLSLAFVLTQRDINQQVPAIQEKVMIWVVFLSCIFEYLLVIVYLMSMLVSAISFYLKTRKVQDYVKDDSSFFDFIHYHYVDTSSVKGYISPKIRLPIDAPLPRVNKYLENFVTAVTRSTKSSQTSSSRHQKHKLLGKMPSSSKHVKMFPTIAQHQKRNVTIIKVNSHSNHHKNSSSTSKLIAASMVPPVVSNTTEGIHTIEDVAIHLRNSASLLANNSSQVKLLSEGRSPHKNWGSIKKIDTKPLDFTKAEQQQPSLRRIETPSTGRHIRLPSSLLHSELASGKVSPQPSENSFQQVIVSRRGNPVKRITILVEDLQNPEPPGNPNMMSTDSRIKLHSGNRSSSQVFQNDRANDFSRKESIHTLTSPISPSITPENQKTTPSPTDLLRGPPDFDTSIHQSLRNGNSGPRMHTQQGESHTDREGTGLANEKIPPHGEQDA